MGAGAILLEAVSDMQMDKFQAARREKKTEAQMINVGLWTWSRHPNYFGEIMWWWAMWLFSQASGGAPVWGVAGPLAITLLFLFVSVKVHVRCRYPQK